MVKPCIGDIGYRYFSTGYGKAHCEIFRVCFVDKSGKTIIIQLETDNKQMITCTWRKSKFVPKGIKSRDYKNYSIQFGPVPPFIKQLMEEEKNIPF